MQSLFSGPYILVEETMRINEENPETQNEVKTKNQTKEVIALCTRFHKENEQRAREETMERFLFSSSVLSFVIGRVV